jgi:hypothetical protein
MIAARAPEAALCRDQQSNLEWLISNSAQENLHALGRSSASTKCQRTPVHGSEGQPEPLRLHEPRGSDGLERFPQSRRDSCAHRATPP